MQPKASVRTNGIKSVGRTKGGLGASEDHAKRLDATSQNRIVRDRDPIAWSKAGDGKELDLIDAFKAHKKELGAVERNKCEIGMHQIVTISPEWLGDGHDHDNPKIHALIKEAVSWVESWQGEGAVFAHRYDLDEKGAGVVDIFSAPVREQGRRGGKRVNTISPNMAKNELKAHHKEKTSGAAMQTGWAEWAQEHLDPSIQRGTPKSITGRDHVHAEVYAKTAELARTEALKAAKQLTAQKQVLDAQGADLAAREAKNEAKKQANDKRTRDLILKRSQLVRDAEAFIQRKELETVEAHALAQSKERSAESLLVSAEKNHAKYYLLQNAHEQLQSRHKSIVGNLTEKLSEKDQTIETLQTENSFFKTKIGELTNVVETFSSYIDLVREKLTSLFPKHFEKINQEIDTAWEQDKRNPDRVVQRSHMRDRDRGLEL